jgi:hypothetical protein
MVLRLSLAFVLPDLATPFNVAIWHHCHAINWNSAIVDG